MGARILIVSGEASGDLHGGALIKALRELEPGVEVVGMGGEAMRAQGLRGIDSRDVSVVGIVEVASRLPAVLEAFRTLKKMLDEERPDAVVLIDFPDFNLRFAEQARRRGVPVVYYISPQVWAWRRGRVRKIRRMVDLMLVVFPFEVDFYRAEGVEVRYVGHPLAERAVCALTQAEARRELGLGVESTVIALLPGSRRDELMRLAPAMAGACELIAERRDGTVEFVLAAADTLDDGLIASALGAAAARIRVVRGAMYRCLRAADAAVVASGTAALETALMGTPMVIVYRLSPLSYLLGRLLVRLRWFGLPNIVAGRKIVPELLQQEVTPRRIALELEALLGDGDRRAAVRADLAGLARLLGGGGASMRAARAVLDVARAAGSKALRR
ncbi:MAG TPA: lipid-A-disaccharide synthase [Deltaproteobacteria bacterium]|nr:lipid-A-disaccharide synthase [Deltaproteobacteria bacterium]